MDRENISQDPAETQRKAEFFQKMIVPTLVYALLYTFFLYNTLSGITVPLCVIATLGYCAYTLKQFNLTLKKDSCIYAGALLLLGISSATTGNSYIIAMNTIAMALILISLLIHNFYDDRKWGFVKSLGSIAETFIYTLESLVDPITDAKSYQKINKKKAHTKSLYILMGVAISVPLVIFIIALLYQADAVFAEVIRKIFEDIDITTVLGVSFLFLFAFFTSYCGMRALFKNKISAENKDYRRYEPLIAITVLITISVVYIFFSMIQIVYLFMGKMQLPDGFTYAQYARQGFFQLLFVCILNVIIVLIVLGFFRKHTMLNILLTIISCCTYIMLASSAFRMIMYVQNCGLTLMRTLVLWTIALIGILLAGILIQIFKENFPLFRFGLLVVAVWYIALSFSHPDYVIAKYNLSDKVNQDEIDYEYLTRLSSDAAAVIAQHDGAWVENYVYQLTKLDNDSIRKFNFSRARALHIFKEKIAKLDNTCCIIIEEPGGVEMQDVVLRFQVNDKTSKQQDIATEKIIEAQKGRAAYIAYIPMELVADAQYDCAVQYQFRRNGKVYTTDTCYIYPSEGTTYLMEMEAHEYEDEAEENEYYLYQERTY